MSAFAEKEKFGPARLATKSPNNMGLVTLLYIFFSTRDIARFSLLGEMPVRCNGTMIFFTRTFHINKI